MKYGKHQPRHFRKNTAGRCKTKQCPQFYKIFEQVTATKKYSVARNFDFNPDEISEIIGKTLDISSTDFTAFNTNFGKYMTIGKNVFINHGCTFLELGGSQGF